jgi:hypothetical protein
MPVCLDTLLIGLYVLAEEFFSDRRGPGRPPKITDAELVCLAVARVLLDCPGDRRFWPGRAGGWDTCSRICPSSRATTSACAPWRPRRFDCSTC